jgi:hypothetical protein
MIMTVHAFNPQGPFRMPEVSVRGALDRVVDRMRTGRAARRAAADRRARVRQIRDEIARLPADIALDLRIYPGDAEELAEQDCGDR